MSLRRDAGEDLTCTLSGERQRLQLLTPEWICSFTNKMFEDSNVLGTLVCQCAHFYYMKKAQKTPQNPVRINSSLPPLICWAGEAPCLGKQLGQKTAMCFVHCTL